jgi:hypothetical protein
MREASLTAPETFEPFSPAGLSRALAGSFSVTTLCTSFWSLMVLVRRQPCCLMLPVIFNVANAAPGQNITDYPEGATTPNRTIQYDVDGRTALAFGP